ncbi:helix-turn-helix domain-containing protein [Gracilibacillus dipsosauri]|uniref:Helicase Helix-turn-helix domain-containing protein n=1 Tax=Gracilibacillus dipsosauri TaxID=178340 RepID=A0A317KZF5_9BACI|nr:helix-turn-helix domain-containing protein [Gracilibacillus dipsosauri]PWU68616.1 hypothetical protein DLJ74_09290 [Gracilibacillus dipsosauri]
MFQWILLYCLQQVQGERSVANIYHLIVGKKSTQSIQDSYIYNLSKYYGIYRILKRDQFEEMIHQLIADGYMKLDQDGKGTLTEKGSLYLVKGSHLQLLSLNGEKFSEKAPAFLDKLLLLIQTMTNVMAGQRGFIPVIDNPLIQREVKQIIARHSLLSQANFSNLYKDLYSHLNTIPSSYADIFVDHMTTYRQVGLSKQQLALKYQVTVFDIHCILMNIIHQLLASIQQSSSFYVLDKIDLVHKSIPITESAQRTYQQLKKGMDIEQIAKRRGLKENTIQDHIIEIAYWENNLVWSEFITKKIYDEILQIVNHLNTNKLKNIKSHLPEYVSYFQIKLVIALENKKSRKEQTQ